MTFRTSRRGYWGVPQRLNGLIGFIQRVTGALGAARASFEESLDLRRKTYAENPADAWVLAVQNDTAAERALYREALDLIPKLSAEETDKAWDRTLGWTYAGHGLLSAWTKPAARRS